MIRDEVRSERRVMPRKDMEVPCTLSRRSGSAITAQTVNLGPGGMRITSARPLAPDEVLRFDLPDQAVDGRCRVLRQDGHQTYALRFEALPEGARERLDTLAGPG
jgi:PilZ domain-containing protein